MVKWCEVKWSKRTALAHCLLSISCWCDWWIAFPFPISRQPHYNQLTACCRTKCALSIHFNHFLFSESVCIAHCAIIANCPFLVLFLPFLSKIIHSFSVTWLIYLAFCCIDTFGTAAIGASYSATLQPPTIYNGIWSHQLASVNNRQLNWCKQIILPERILLMRQIGQIVHWFDGWLADCLVARFSAVWLTSLALVIFFNG